MANSACSTSTMDRIEVAIVELTAAQDAIATKLDKLLPLLALFETTQHSSSFPSAKSPPLAGTMPTPLPMVTSQHSLQMTTPPRSPPFSPPPPIDATSHSPPTLKRTRKATGLRSLAATRPVGAERPLVHVDPTTGKADGPHRKKLRTYLGIIAPSDLRTKKKILQTVGERWRQFKSDLMSKWELVADKDSVDDIVCEKYDINKEKWTQFCQSRRDPLWEDVRKKAQDSLEDHASQGSFVAHGHQDVLTVAIGRQEHPGRVHAVGVGPSAARVNIKESYVYPSSNDPYTGDSEKYGLYVEENLPRLVALGRLYEGSTTVHNMSLRHDQLKVGVEEVRDVDALIPIPTQKGVLGPTKPIDRPDHDVDDPLYLMTLTIPQLFLKPLQVMWDVIVFGMFNDDFPLYIKHEDLFEIAHGGQCLNISVIQLWILSMVGTKNTFYNVMDFGAHGNGKSDDSHAFSSAWQHTCGTQGTSTLVIPPKGVFLVSNITLKGPCKARSIHILLQGKIVAPAKDAWAKGLDPLILISNLNGLTIDGSGGQIDGFGSTWWKCRSCLRPRVISFVSCNDLTVRKLSISNSPRAHITIDGCNGAIFSNINIHAPRNSPNTDGFDIAFSKNILIEDCTIATGDDCIAINGGSSYINATGIACGPGHGISLGKHNAHETVEEIYVYNCSFTKTTNGARIKTVPGGTGYAKRITFEKIKLIQTRNPIILDQFYHSVHLTTGVVQVSEVTYRGFQGTSANDKAINLDCGPSGCFNIVLDQIDIVSSDTSKPAHCSCNNAHGTTTSTVPNCSCLLK
ncbi:putative polygalacturonase [Glycine soja]